MHLRLRPLDLTPDDLTRIQTEVFFKRKAFTWPGRATERTDISRFWILLVLSAIIAAAGVANDSTATVIGAMIVAPLMTPILGLALAIVLADRTMLMRSVVLIFFGALIVIGIGFAFGTLDFLNATIEGNGQVTSRINPNLIDLIAAFATGLVGAFALVRRDISDTLPGVAIAISLVPPLVVSGLVLQSGQMQEAWGALLLFLTNVSAIVAMGVVTLAFYGIRDLAQKSGARLSNVRKSSIVLLTAAVVVVGAFLYVGTERIARDHFIKAKATPIATEWAEERGWVISELKMDNGVLGIQALGPVAPNPNEALSNLPEPEPATPAVAPSPDATKGGSPNAKESAKEKAKAKAKAKAEALAAQAEAEAEAAVAAAEARAKALAEAEAEAETAVPWPSELRLRLNESGLSDVELDVALVYGREQRFPALPSP